MPTEFPTVIIRNPDGTPHFAAIDLGHQIHFDWEQPTGVLAEGDWAISYPKRRKGKPDTHLCCVAEWDNLELLWNLCLTDPDLLWRYFHYCPGMKRDFAECYELEEFVKHPDLPCRCYPRHPLTEMSGACQ